MKVREAIKASLGLLSKRDRRLLGVSVLIQMSTSILDLVGVLLLGLVGALAVTVVQSQPTPGLVQTVADSLGLDWANGQELVIIFAATAAAVLLSKSVISAYLTRRVLVFLANRQALVAARLTKALLERPLTFLLNRSSQETAYALIQGAGHATIQVLGQWVIATTEITLLAVLAVALLFLDPVVTLASVAFFAVVAIILQRIMGGWASRVGQSWAQADIASLDAIQEALTAYREVMVAHRRMFYVDRIEKLRWRAAKVAADSTFISVLPKYVFEAALVIGGFGLAAGLFITQDAISAVSTLALFLAAGTRVMPSLLRFQASTLILRSASGSAEQTFALARDLNNPLETMSSVDDPVGIKQLVGAGFPDFNPVIEMHSVSFSYPDASSPAVTNVSVSLPAGQSLALVGSSGAGKSTVADLILGVLRPQSGVVTIGGMSPLEAIEAFPGGLAYVPQEVVLANSTIRENVALGLPGDAIDDELVWEALKRAHLDKYLHGQRQGLDTHIGESGMRLSGGQRQRLGIARALYSRPKLIVLDEATSALDAETENSISQTLRELEGEVTLVVVAHRLSIVRHVDLLLYLEGGQIVSSGTFREVCDAVPSLQRQVELLGLDFLPE